MSDRDVTGLGGAHQRVPVERWRLTGGETAAEEVATEVPIAFIYNGVPFAVMLATPQDLDDFALGFSLTEGVIASAAECQGVEVVPEARGYSVYMSIPKERSEAISTRRRSLAGRTGCGLCGTQLLEDALRPVAPVTNAARFAAGAVQAGAMALGSVQALNAITGAVHAAAWCDQAGAVRLVREDIGRHNALDKLIGALLSSGTDGSTGFVIVTSRASYEMVHKCAAAGIGLIAAVSAPTSLAIDVATAANVTLIGFTRAGRHTVYANPGRVTA